MTNGVVFLGALFLVSFPIAAQERGGQEHGGQEHGQPGGAGQHANGPRANPPVGHGYIPQRGPAPNRDSGHAHSPVPVAAPSQGRVDNQRRGYRDQSDHPEAPHVHPQRDVWVGHDSGRGDARYRLERPWEHGRFVGNTGPRYVYRIRGGTTARFDLDGNFFQVAPSDYDLCGNWDWNGDGIVLYPDPDHDGWYLAYNPRLGTYVHVEYLGG